MNLVMPLADQTAVGRAPRCRPSRQDIDELFTGLSNVGTVHQARFDLVGGNLCMFSVFDGDFADVHPRLHLGVRHRCSTP